MTPEEWTLRHPVAAAELYAMVLPQCEEVADAQGAESAVQAAVRLEASKIGARLWRNNVGAGKLDNGSFLRWGLCNDSPAVNKRIKSADLIGIRPIRITLEHVGRVIGQFVSREIKHPGWVHKPGNEREAAQLRWAELIVAMGGDAKIVTGTGSF